MRATRTLSALLLVTVLSTVLSTALGPVSPAAAADRNPVIFVHGISGSASNFGPMIDGFKRAGYSAEELHSWSYDWSKSNKLTAEKLRTKIEAVLASTGADQVDIVSHSMGGISTRWYLKFLGGTSKVDDWVSIGAPHHGTNLSPLCSWLLASCRELDYDSAILLELNSGDETPGPVNYVNLWSSCDEMINPDQSATLEGAQNIFVGCVEHAWLLIHGGTAQRTRDAVR